MLTSTSMAAECRKKLSCKTTRTAKLTLLKYPFTWKKKRNQWQSIPCNFQHNYQNSNFTQILHRARDQLFFSPANNLKSENSAPRRQRLRISGLTGRTVQSSRASENFLEKVPTALQEQARRHRIPGIFSLIYHSKRALEVAESRKRAREQSEELRNKMNRTPCLLLRKILEIKKRGCHVGRNTFLGFFGKNWKSPQARAPEWRGDLVAAIAPSRAPRVDQLSRLARFLLSALLCSANFLFLFCEFLFMNIQNHKMCSLIGSNIFDLVKYKNLSIINKKNSSWKTNFENSISKTSF